MPYTTRNLHQFILQNNVKKIKACLDSEVNVNSFYEDYSAVDMLSELPNDSVALRVIDIFLPHKPDFFQRNKNKGYPLDNLYPWRFIFRDLASNLIAISA